MISIQQTLSELERTHQMRTVALECYLAAIKSVAQYPVELDPEITRPHCQYLSDLAVEVSAASAEALSESRSTLRGLLRDYHARGAKYLAGLRDQMRTTAEALQEIVEGLNQSDTDHSEKLHSALDRLREAAKTPAGLGVRPVLVSAADVIEQSLEQIRKQHQLTLAQFQTEIRLLHGRIQSLETAAAVDEASKFSNRRFLTEYLGSMPSNAVSFLILKLQGLGAARGKYGQPLADDLVGTFGRRLRNTVPKDAVVGRWSDQDFLAIMPANKPADALLCRRVADHLSMPYACMIGGKVVRVPVEVTAEYLVVPAGTPTEQILARVTEAFA